MITRLCRYELNFEQTMPFVKDRLENVNTLCSKLLKQVEFRKGSFFTLLTEGSHLEHLHKFEYYILPQNEEITSADGRSTYSETPSVDNELATLIGDKLQSRDKVCIFDDVVDTYDPNDDNGHLFEECGYFIDNEIYFILTPTTATQKLIKNCMFASREIWHSLYVLASSPSHITGKRLDEQYLDELVSNVELMMIGAYDGESYVFWEPKEEVCS